MNGKRLFLLLLFCGALLLRLYGIKLGLPSETGGLTTLHPDESVTFYSLERMKPEKLDFYPGASINWGTFYLYSVGAAVKAMSAAGLVKLGDRSDLKKMLGEVDKMYLAARLISALCGALSAVLLFFIGELLMSRRAAGAAALFFAVAQAPVMASGLVKTDSAMLLWGLAAVYFSFRLLREPTRRNYCLTGFFLGLAMVTKYSALLLAFFPFAAHFRQAWLRRDPLAEGRSLALAVLSGLAVFCLLNPYLLDSANWIYLGNARKGAIDGGAGSYLSYFSSLLPAAFGWGPALLALAGLASWLRRGSFEQRLVAAYCALFLLWAGGASFTYVLYALPVVPFLSLAAGGLADRLLEARRGRPLAAAALLQGLAFTLCVRSYYSSDYTILEADRWLRANVPVSATVAVPKSDAWTPFSVRRRTGGFKVLEAAPPSVTQTDALTALGGVYRGADYLVLASWEFGPPERKPEAFPAAAAALNALLAGSDEVARFLRPLPRWALPVDRGDTGLHVNFMNPEIRIYKVRKG